MNPTDQIQNIKRRQYSRKIQQWKKQRQQIPGVLDQNSTSGKNTAAISTATSSIDPNSSSIDTNTKRIEMKLIQQLCDCSTVLPLDYSTLQANIPDEIETSTTTISDILDRFRKKKLIDISEETDPVMIIAVDSKRLTLLREKYEIWNRRLESETIAIRQFLTGGGVTVDELLADGGAATMIELENIDEVEEAESSSKTSSKSSETEPNSVDSILSLQSAKEKQNKKIADEIQKLLTKPTAKELSLIEQFQSATGHVQEFCKHGTREECRRVNRAPEPCAKLHFLKIIQRHTDESLGDCSFLNTCFHMDSCKYVHYRVEVKNGDGGSSKSSSHTRNSHNKSTSSKNISNYSFNINRNTRNNGNSCSDNDIATVGRKKYSNNENKNCETQIEVAKSAPLMKTLATATEQPFKRVLFPSQWIRCDLRFFDMSVLGKFSVVMADPPWDIHMELPYGTMSDDEMRNLNIPTLQDEGVIFLWVTGRAMELGRECLKLWGYERCDELIWVKTNQLQRIIRTGRTGHWINHGKEHCLVGMKGNARNLNRGLDCDVIVAEVRATSHKPDEIYGIIERLSPGTRKIELFGRQHNTQPNWVTLGNQLDGIKIVDPQLIEMYRKRYPEEARLMSFGEDGGMSSIPTTANSTAITGS